METSTTTEATDFLARLIDRKHRILKDLLVMSLRQYEIIKDREEVRLRSLFATKQGVIDDLLQVEKALEPYRADEPNSRIWRSEELRSVVRNLCNENEKLLGNIRSIDQLCERLLKEQMATLSVEVDTQADLNSAVRAYRNVNLSIPMPPRFEQASE